VVEFVHWFFSRRFIGRIVNFLPFCHQFQRLFNQKKRIKSVKLV